MTSPAARLSSALADRYRIERELGQGGMATVYLAEDIKHKRKVALKVLKPELAAVLGAERFVQEITTTAALQHPHILPLFDSGTADGFLFYVMPFIDGETLRAKLDRETQLGVDDAVRIASDVASALHYAHQHGVIHRDIKPENILLHDGRPMVADFGIALAVSAAAGGRMTETGLSLGTPHYMSPEQATAAKDISARSDVYSLASVLYEMLAGEPPHTAGSAQQIIMKIIAEPVQPVTQLRKNVPPNVAAAVAKALEKLPADRFESAKAFGEALANRSFTTASATEWSGVAGARGVSKRMFASVAAVAAAAIAVAAWALLRPPRVADGPVVRMTMELPAGQRLFLAGAGSINGAVSPQGDRIAYVAQDSMGAALYVRRTSEPAGRAVTRVSVGDLAFSPDGRWIAYIEGNDIKKVPSDGGASVPIGNAVNLSVRGMAWMRSDTIVIGSNDGLLALPAAGGTARPFAGTDSSVNGTFPVVLADGHTIALAVGGLGSQKLALTRPGQSHVTVLDVPATAAIGMREGHLLYVTTTGTMMAVPVDLKAQRITGESVQVEDGIGQSTLGAAHASLSESGTLWYLTGESTSRLMLSLPNGTLEPLFADVRNYRYPRFSPDWRKVAVGVTDAKGSDIWVYDRVDHTFQRLTTDGTNFAPEWSPDGKRILFRSTREGKSDVWWQVADGSAKAEPLYQGESVNEAVMSPDAKWLIYRTAPGGRFIRDIFAIPLTGDKTPVLLVGGPFQESHARVSPDGKWLAYQSNESGRHEVYVRPFPNSGSRTQVSTQGGGEPVWSHSGKELLYRAPSGITSVAVTTGTTFALHGRRVILSGDFAEDITHANYDVAPDGRLLVVKPSGAGASAVLVHNWGRELREKLAVVKK